MLFKKKIIFGCDSRGDGDSPYLTRWSLLNSKKFAVYLHKFHRSDADEHHDHPWGFVSIILWRGYFEETPCLTCKGTGKIQACNSHNITCPDCAKWKIGGGVKVKRVWPGMILVRPATWRHRVVLVDGKPAVTLIIRSQYVREWGFFTSKGWQHWREYFKERGC